MDTVSKQTRCAAGVPTYKQIRRPNSSKTSQGITINIVDILMLKDNVANQGTPDYVTCKCSQFKEFTNKRIASEESTEDQKDEFKILENVDWPEQFSFKDEDFQRFDESSDLVFYESPRFVTHIDDPTIVAVGICPSIN
ncbi:hypothetical protein Tco_0586066 [Tanacetum coccineum]